jgi:hypothetical protein
LSSQNGVEVLNLTAFYSSKQKLCCENQENYELNLYLKEKRETKFHNHQKMENFSTLMKYPG